MDTKALVCFRRVAELQHMTKAAKELYMSQSQLSRIIADTEKEMGTQLFDRTGRNIRLNEAGKVFYQYVLKISTDYEDAKDAVHAVLQREMYQVAFGSNVGAYTIELLTYLLKEMPDVKVRDVSASRHSLISMLQDGRIDFAITTPGINDIGMTSEVMFYEQACVIYPEGHWLQGRESVRLEELLDETLVGVPRGYGARDAMEEYYTKYDLDHHFAIETGNTPMVARYVENGLGIAIVPKSLALLDPFSCSHYIDFEEPIPCPIVINRVTDNAMTEQQQRFYKLAKSFLADKFGTLANS